ncbi:hypothetical protein EMIT0P258_130077 [Pseudomonas sp. IT-P258]
MQAKRLSKEQNIFDSMHFETTKTSNFNKPESDAQTYIAHAKSHDNKSNQELPDG